MANQRLELVTFYILLALATLGVLFMWWPFLELLALAGILAILFKPWQKRIQKRVKSPAWSSLLAVLSVLVIVLLPLGLLGFAIYREVVDIYHSVGTGTFNLNRGDIVSRLPESLQPIGQNFLANIGDRLSNIAGTTVQGVTRVVSNVASFLFASFVVFFSLFYLLRDSDKLREFINRILPLSEAHETKLLDRLEMAVNGVVKGSFLIALSQGVVATIGFIIFGVPQPFLWGAFTVLAALVPTFGTSLALIPAVLYLLLTGHVGAGIGLAIWGGVAVGTIDNFISPRLIGHQTELHPLVVLFAVLGGLQLFGLLGFLIGPILMAVFMALLNLYRTEIQGAE